MYDCCSTMPGLALRVRGPAAGGTELRWALAAGLAAFSLVVSSSLVYGVYLLVRTPRTALSVAARPAPLPADAEALFERAKSHLAKGEVEQALVAYRRILFTGPSLEARLGLAECERLAGRDDLAASEYERVLDLDGRNATALAQLAEIRSRTRDGWPAANGFYRRYLEVRPEDAAVQLRLARLLLWQGRPPAAAELYAREAVQGLMTPADHRDQALALLAAGRREEAEPLLEKLLAASPGDREVALAVAGLRASRGRWDAALPHYRDALRSRPEDPHLNLAYGQGLLAGGDYARALNPLATAARALPSNGDAALAYARATRGAGDIGRAERLFETAVSLNPGDPGVAREYGDLLMERRNHRRAETQYRNAQALGLRDDRLLIALAGALAANGKPNEAVPLLEDVYSRQRSDRLAYDLARLYKRLGRNERALELLAELERSQGR